MGPSKDLKGPAAKPAPGKKASDAALRETPALVPPTRPLGPTLVPEVSDPTLTEPPEQFGRYHILKKLGQGGMGAVYLAHDTQLDRRVALKVPSASLASEAAARERFFREARAASTLNHPNLCPVYDVGEQYGLYYLTMPYVEGRPLSELIQGTDPLPPRQVAALVRKLALAMQEAHARGVTHRDLKPSNILITSRHEPVIVDFGLARRDSEAARLTQPGMLMGTPAYMAPEQATGDTAAVGPVSDVYSLGVILYELLTARLPFTGSLAEVLGQVIGRDPAPPSRYRPELHPALETICLKAMAKKPEGRYRSMAEMAAALTAYLGQGRVVAPMALPVPTAVPVGPAPAGGSRTAPMAVPVTSPPESGAEVPGLATQLAAELLARLDRHPPRSVSPRVWFAAAVAGLALLGAVLWFAVRRETPHQTIYQDNRVTVTVQLVGLPVDVNDKNLVYFLNGREINPAELRGKVQVDVGENKLVVKRGKEVIEQRVFQVSSADEAKPVRVPRDESAQPVKVRLDVKGVDEDDKELKVVLDGKEMSPAQLKSPLSLRRGLHELVVKRGNAEVKRSTFAVAPGDEGKTVEVTVDTPTVYGTVKVSDAVKAILPLLADKEPAVRREAALSLGALKDRTAVLPLCNQLGDVHPGVRKATAESLVKLGDPAAAPALRKRVEDAVWYNPWVVGEEDPEAGGKAAALRGLRALAPEQVTDALAVALTSPVGHMRRWAARELADQKEKKDLARAVPALRKQVAADNWYQTRYRGDHDPEWGGKGDCLTLLRNLAADQVTGALVEALKGRHPAQRRWAAEQLGLQKDRAAIAPLRERVGDDVWYAREFRNVDPDPVGGGKTAALKVLRELDARQATEPLCRALFSTVPEQRKWAADELAIQKDAAAVPALKKRIADDTWDPRTGDTAVGAGKGAALKALKTLASGEVKDALTAALKSKDANVRRWAVAQLGVEGRR